MTGAQRGEPARRWRAPRDGGYHPTDSTPEPTVPPQGTAGTSPRPTQRGEPAPYSVEAADGLVKDLAHDLGIGTRCRNVLHIDWDADPAPVREGIARCVLDAPHEGKRHQGKDAGGLWFRW